MKNDIDFDELDRAVNSLMGGVGPSAGAAEEKKAKTLSISSTLKPGETPAYEKVDELAKRIGSETLTTDADPTIVKNIGEISHTEAQAIAVSTKSSASVEPTSDPVSELPVAEAKEIADTTENESQAEPIVVKTPSPAVQRPSAGRFMDVVHPSSDMKSATPPVVATEPAPIAEPVAIPAQSVASDVEVSSPFLPDAKVEKRPLGESIPTAKEPAIELNDAPEEIVAINSEALERHGAATGSQNVLDASQFESSTVDKQLQQIESAQGIVLPENQAEELRAVESVDSTAATGQQGAIFDVKDYHQPLNHPPKRKSGWGIVVVIVIIIIVAAAIGAGAYFLLGLGN